MKPIAPWWRTRRVGRPSVYARTHLPPLCPVWTGRHASAFILLCFISATCSAVRVNSRLLPDKQTSKVGTKRIPTECKHCVPRDPRRRCRIKFRFSFIHLCSINCLFICSFDVFFLLFLIFLGDLYVYSAISVMMAPDCCSPRPKFDWRTHVTATSSFSLPLSYRLSVRVENGRHETSVASQIIEIVHQDDDVVVIDKPCSIPVRKCCRLIADGRHPSTPTVHPNLLSLISLHVGFLVFTAFVGIFNSESSFSLYCLGIFCFSGKKKLTSSWLLQVFLAPFCFAVPALCLGRIAETWW